MYEQNIVAPLHKKIKKIISPHYLPLLFNRQDFYLTSLDIYLPKLIHWPIMRLS